MHSEATGATLSGMAVPEIGRRILDAAGVTLGGDAPHDITIHDDRFWDRVLSDRELCLGESYQDGWWDANQLDEFLTVAHERP